VSLEPATVQKNSLYKKDVQNFGTLAERKSILLRDPHKTPFKDPTFKNNPSPADYLKRSPLDRSFDKSSPVIPN
jgi:hypothetical protein